MTIQEKAKYFFIQVYEFQTGVNLQGIMPLKSDSKQYQWAKKTTIQYFENRNKMQISDYIRDNF